VVGFGASCSSRTVTNREFDAPGELVGGVEVGDDDDTLFVVVVRMMVAGCKDAPAAPPLIDCAAIFTAVSRAALGAPSKGRSVGDAPGAAPKEVLETAAGTILGTAALLDEVARTVPGGEAVGLEAVVTTAGSGKLSSSSNTGLLLGDVEAYAMEELRGWEATKFGDRAAACKTGDILVM